MYWYNDPCECGLIVDTKDDMEGFNLIDDESGLLEGLKMLFSKDNIELKSEIRNPPAMAMLKVLAEKCAEIGFEKTAKTLNDYIKYTMEFFVSYNRKGRSEFVDAYKWASNQIAIEKSYKDSFTSDLRNKTI